MKIFSPYQPEINATIKTYLPQCEFVEQSAAEVVLPDLPTPLRLGLILDYLADHKTLKIADLTLNFSRNTLSSTTHHIEITEKEASMLKYLAENRRIVSRDEMIKNIWNYADSTDSKTVESHVYRLRGKIAEAFGREIIITDGSGYKLIEN